MGFSSIFKVPTTIRIVPGALEDVPECGHVRNQIPTCKIGVKLHFFQKQVRKRTFQVILKYQPLSGLSLVPSGMFWKAEICGTVFLQAILMSNFMFFNDKYVNGHFKYF